MIDSGPYSFPPAVLCSRRRKEPRQHHPWFNDWLYPAGEPLHSLTGHITGLLDHQEQESGQRARQRRQQVADERRDAIGVIVANLAFTTLTQPNGGRFAVVRGKTPLPPKRYRSPASGRMRTALLDQFDAIGLADARYSRRRGEASSYAPTMAFRKLCGEHGVNLQDMGHLASEEVIQSRARRDPKRPAPPILLDYEETQETGRMRAQVIALNRHLEGADLTFNDDGLGPVNVLDRHQRRLFNGSASSPFSGGGRLYGGFWQNLKRERRAHLRINGEATVVVDFSSMFVRLAYARLGQPAPEGDLYAIPGLEDHRDAVKVLVSTLFFDGSTRQSWPEDDDLVIPPGWPLARARAAILSRHEALRPCFGKGLGHELMRMESDIMMMILDGLKEEGITALNLHDGLIVPLSLSERTRTLMMEVGVRMTGHLLPVSITPTT
jgi:hypothetical protein